MVTGLSVQFYAHTLPVAHVVEKSLLHGVVDNGGVIIRRAVVALTDIVVELLGIRVKPIPGLRQLLYFLLEITR